MTLYQKAILAPVPGLSRYLEFNAVPDSDATATLKSLAALPIDDTFVFGFGPGFINRFVSLSGTGLERFRGFPALSGPGVEIPSTQADIWCWIRGDDKGKIMHDGRLIEHILQATFSLDRLVDGFKYDTGRDLTGYIDGTENPEGQAAQDAALVADAAPGLGGSSFVAVQQWDHDLDHFGSLAQTDQDNIIGRRLEDNEELDDAPPSAHVKRTAQESFDPEAFVVRRSMPWADASGEGLMFVAFGKDLDAFEVQLRRMAGLDDGIVDGLFRFSRPVSGSYFWCPPVKDGHLDLSAINL
jgi:porphyrinogen peroxidase